MIFWTTTANQFIGRTWLGSPTASEAGYADCSVMWSRRGDLKERTLKGIAETNETTNRYLLLEKIRPGRGVICNYFNGTNY